MKKIKSIISEIEHSLRRIDIFLIVIKTLVILMFSYLLLFVIGIEPYYAFMPAVIYFISSLSIESYIDHVKRIEGRYVQLQDKLRTARDHQQKDNPILQDLEDEITTDLKQVELTSFFSYTRVFVLVFILLIAVSSSLYLASNSKNIKLIDIDDMLNAAIKQLNEQPNNTIREADFTTANPESIMQVGNERLQVEINPVGMDLDFTETSQDSEYEFTTEFPDEVFISSGAADSNEYTEEQQMLIKRYFEKKKMAPKGG